MKAGAFVLVGEGQVPLVFMTVAAENRDQSAIGQRVDYAQATDIETAPLLVPKLENDR